MRHFFVGLFLLLVWTTALATPWKTVASQDAMTDALTFYSETQADDGNSLTAMRRDDGSVWLFVKLAGMRQFNIHERLLVRFDKNEPVAFDNSLEESAQRLGINLGVHLWEWNPSLIGFQIWHGKLNEGCGKTLPQLLRATQIVIRYHPNDSTYKDIVFNDLSGQADLLRALQLSPGDCTSQ